MEIILILHNIRSIFNVGSILRTAEGFGIKKVIFSGYTPRYNDKNLLPHLREKLNKGIEKTALGAEKIVKITTSDDISKTLTTLKSENYQIIGLENNLDDPRLHPINDKNLKITLKNQKIALILGEEVNGIDKELYKNIDLFLEIPMEGKKESFNVSIATGIALYALKLA